MNKVSAKRIDGYTHELSNGRGHTVIGDEPPEAGGADKGPRPTELLAMSLASCTAITMEMYADRKGFDLSGLEVDVTYETNRDERKSVFDLVLKLPPGLTDEQVERLEVIAGKCPVHRMLVGEIEINDRVELLAG